MASRLDNLDLSQSLTHDESEKRIQKAQRRLTQLRLFTGGLLDAATKGPGLLVLFEGFDAAGKGGAIQRLTNSIDPRHARVVSIGPPSEEELSHHFLWRFQQSLPGRGEMTVYDRSCERGNILHALDLTGVLIITQLKPIYVIATSRSRRCPPRATPWRKAHRMSARSAPTTPP